MAERYDLGPVVVYDATKNLGIARAQLESHSICFHHEDVVCEDTVDGKTEKHLWCQGAVGFIPAGTDLRSVPEHPYAETGLLFKPGLLAKACESEIDHSRIDFRFADITCSTCYPIAQSLRNAALEGGFEKWPLLIESAALTLSVAVIRKLAPASSLAFLDTPFAMSRERKQRVVDYIEANIHRRISLTELSGTANLSQWHFLRQFQNSFGMTPMDYIRKRRVALAKILLRSTSKPLAEISLDCGFASQSSFTTLFGRETGATPREYRYLGLK